MAESGLEPSKAVSRICAVNHYVTCPTTSILTCFISEGSATRFHVNEGSEKCISTSVAIFLDDLLI